MARFRDFNHGPNGTRHGEKVSHIRPFNWNHELLGSKHFPKASLTRHFFRSGKRQAGTSEKQVARIDPALSNKTFLLNNWFSWLRSSCSYFS